MRPKLMFLVVTSVVVLFLPVLLVGLMPYDDETLGFSTVGDCNVPDFVLLVTVPSLVIYAAAATYYALRIKGARPRLSTLVLAVACVALAFAAGRQAWAAHSEQSKLPYREVCGRPGMRGSRGSRSDLLLRLSHRTQWNRPCRGVARP